MFCGGRSGRIMWRFTKILILAFALVFAGLVAYAYLGPMVFANDFIAPAQEVVRPVTLQAN